MSNFAPTLGAKPAFADFQAKNAESSASIPIGTPAILALNGTDDGLAVVLPATATATLSPLAMFGVARETVAAGKSGKFQTYGFCRNSILTVRTRAASTDSFSSVASIDTAAHLAVDTVNNAFVSTVATRTQKVVTNAISDTLALTLSDGAFWPPAILAESRASIAGVASATSLTATVSTAMVKTFLRLL